MKKVTNVILILMLAIAVAVTSCGDKEEEHGQIPNIYVNVELYPNSVDPIPVSTWSYVNGGYRGIIVYRYDQNTFYAYERTCPYDPEKSCAVIQGEKSSVTAVDSCCMSKFLLTDGTPFSGPATRSLKQYQTSFDGTKLVIFNQP